MSQSRVAIIGGSGLYTLQSLTDVEEHNIDTPYGAPSDSIVTGLVEQTLVAFLPRHGKLHTISPSEIPTKANIYALKSLGVSRIISVSAVGSMRSNIKPLDLIIPNQLIDRTKMRSDTFFEQGIVAHIAFAEPFCPLLATLMANAIASLELKLHNGGTYIVIEGPAFSTKAESLLYQSWGASIIGMTALPEARLAREAEMCYSTLACATDYDCWLETEAPVTAETVLANVNKNTSNVKNLLEILLPQIPRLEKGCSCQNALSNSIITPLDQIDPKVISTLGPIISRYI